MNQSITSQSNRGCFGRRWLKSSPYRKPCRNGDPLAAADPERHIKDDMKNGNNPDAARNSGRTTSLDAVIGSRLRLARMNAGLTQTTVAERLGITFQQVQKYEKGSNRVSASTLHNIAGIFGLPITFFFQGIEKSAASPNLTLRKAEFALTKRGQRLLESFQSASPKVQASIIVLLTAAAGSADDEDLELQEQLGE